MASGREGCEERERRRGDEKKRRREGRRRCERDGESKEMWKGHEREEINN